MQNKLTDGFPSCLIHFCCTTLRNPSAASEPRTTTFCARFNSRSYNAEIIQLQSALDDEYNSFSGNIKPFFKTLFPDVHFGAVSLIHSALHRNAATLRKVLALFSFSHVINYCSFFLSFWFFSRSFLIFMVTSD